MSAGVCRCADRPLHRSRASELKLPGISNHAILAQSRLNPEMKPEIEFPPFTGERFIARIGELVALVEAPSKFSEHPKWLQNILRQLKNQLIPPELSTTFTADGGTFTAGLMAGFLPGIKDFLAADPHAMKYSLKIADQMVTSSGGPAMVSSVLDGSLVKVDDLRREVADFLFASDATQRRMFIQGLSVGNRLQEILQQAVPRETDATQIYFVMWMYWPEVNAAGSIGSVARAFERLYVQQPHVLGVDWQHRFRKLANRIRLSFAKK